MTRINLILVLSIVLFAVTSCKETEKERSTLIIESEVVDLSDKPLSEIVSDIKLIPLETNDSCLIADIVKVVKRNGKYYMLVEANNKHILLFNEDGSFNKLIAKNGQGPFEYGMILDYDVDDNRMIILDGEKFGIYDSQGNPKKEIHHDIGWGKNWIKLVPGGWIVSRATPLENGNRVVLYNNNGDTVKSFATSQYDKRSYRGNGFFEFDKERIAKPIGYGQDLFLINPETMQTDTLKVSDDTNIFTAQEYYEADEEGTVKDIRKPYLNHFISNDSHITWWKVNSPERTWEVYIYDKKNGKAIKFPKEIKNDLTFDKETEMAIFSEMNINMIPEGEYFMTMILDPSNLKDYLDKIPARFKKEYEKIKDIPDDANPVVALIKF